MNYAARFIFCSLGQVTCEPQAKRDSVGLSASRSLFLFTIIIIPCNVIRLLYKYEQTVNTSSSYAFIELPEDIFKSIRTMAELHQRMHIPTVEYYIEPSLENGYLRHNQELKKIRSFIRKRGASSPFEKIYLATVEDFLRDGEEAYAALRESGYQELRQKAETEGEVCHGEYNQHNVLILKSGTAVTNFEHWGFDTQMADLYRFMRKILEKYNWDVRFGKEMLKAYHEIKPVSREEWTNLKIRFSYPEKYWKLANYYYTHRKTWISVKNTEKLQNLIRQREAWKRYCASFFF